MSFKLEAKQLPALGWSLSLLAFALAFVAWGQDLNWRFNNLSSYKIFPLLGLTAFSLMWAHYIIAAKRKYLRADREVTKKYFDQSGIIVLLAFLSHPGLLIVQLYRDGFGLPPNSYLDNYVAKGAAWAAMLGTLSLITFLIYELRFKFKDKSWWRFVQYASDAAMLAILVHGLKLGRHVQDGWYRWVWIFYGVSLLLSLVYIHYPTGEIKKKG